MKTQIFKLFLISFAITLSSCKEEPSLEYKYADSPKALACEFKNAQLYNEAIHSFEDDIRNYYDKQNKNINAAYSGFTANTLNGQMKVESMASEHSLNIAKLLKAEGDLWIQNGESASLNHAHPMLDCIANNIKAIDIKETFNALLATNSMRKKLILTPLRSNTRQLPTDGSLKAFLAFEYYFPQLLNMDASQLTKPQPKPVTTDNKVDFNKTPAQPIQVKPKVENDPHAGHNHN